MARVFILFEDDDGRQTGRGTNFAGALAYALRVGPECWHGAENLLFPIAEAAVEMVATYRTKHREASRSGPRTRRPVLHAVLGWHADDAAWLTWEHVTQTVRAALRHMRLGEHQSAWAMHTDTGKPHVHLVANLVHPETGDVARLGLIKKRMSEFCADYEQALGDVRCKRRKVPKAANESRNRLGRRQRETDKRKTSHQPAPRP
jgi:hypothetical protein